jgi:hypothetical protein
LLVLKVVASKWRGGGGKKKRGEGYRLPGSIAACEK